MYDIYRKYKVYVWQKHSFVSQKLEPLVKKLAPLLLAEFSGFGAGSDITRLSYSGFAQKIYPSKANFEAQVPIRAK